jgi:hypothetical protein
MGITTHDFPSFDETGTYYERHVSLWTPVTKNENDDGHQEKVFVTITTQKLLEGGKYRVYDHIFRSKCYFPI